MEGGVCMREQVPELSDSWRELSESDVLIGDPALPVRVEPYMAPRGVCVMRREALFNLT